MPADRLLVHHLENSRSQRVLWLLEELGVPYEVKRYLRDKKTMLAPPELRAIHPLGKSPVVTDGDNTLAEFYQDRGFSTSVMSPRGFPLQPATLTDLAGGDRHANAEIIRRLLRGEERGPKRDAVLLNTAAALFVAGRTRSLIEGWDLAAEIIDSGRAEAKLAELARH